MAGDTFSLGTNGYLEGRIVWSSSSNGSSANSSQVTATIQAHRTNTGYTTTGTWTGNLNIGGDNRSFSVHAGITNAWYTLASFTITKGHNSDGSGSCYIQGQINGPSGTSMSGKSVSGDATVTLDKIARYTTCSQSLVSKTETSITMKWNAADIVDYIWYSTNNGSSWKGIDVTDGTSGTYTISGLTANTTYNIKTRVRRRDSQLTTDSSAASIATYDYPYCSSSPNFIIGNEVKLDLYNPLSRSVSVTMIGNDNKIIGSGDTSGTSISGFNNQENINNLYSSIPNAKSSTYQVQVKYGDIIKTRNNGNTYTVNQNVCIPTVGELTYKDINATVVAITENNQIIVRNQSSLQFNCAEATAKNNASISKYEVTFNNVSNERETAGTLDFGTINLSSNTTATLIVTDSRGFTEKTTCKVTIDDWIEPYAVTSLKRKNNYEAETYLKVDGTISSVNSKNSMTIQYRYKKTSEENYGQWNTLRDNTEVTISLDNKYSFNIQVQITDKFATTTYNYILAIGMPIIFIDAATQKIGINKFPDSNGERIQIDGGISVNNIIVDEDILANDIEVNESLIIGGIKVLWVE